MNTQQTNKLWGAGFAQKPSEAVIAFTAGRDVASPAPSDSKLMPYDIWVNKVHCVMLIKTGIIPATDGVNLLIELDKLGKLVQLDKFSLDPSKEDVHTNIESWLTEKLGIEVAGKLHTARSRNDQIATDTKLYLKDQIIIFIYQIMELTRTLLRLSQQHIGTFQPGFTHYQHAMVATLGHTFAGFAAMLTRDAKRLSHWLSLHNASPLGAVASYGTTFPIDPNYCADLLGLDGPMINSMDAITNRWEAESDVTFDICVLMNHLSTLAQTLLVWATPEFGMVKLADEFSTGSSTMPQKKNPDPLEVIRGKTSFVQGQLVSLLGIGKANFIGYNRDTQWTKYIVMDVIDECLTAPAVMKGVLETMTVNKEIMALWSTKGMIGATSLLEQFAQANNIPFRIAKIVVEKAIKYSEASDVVHYGAMCKAIEEEHVGVKVTRKQIRDWQDPKHILENTNSAGGPGEQSVLSSLALIEKECHALNRLLDSHKQRVKTSKKLLVDEMKKIMEKGDL